MKHLLKMFFVAGAVMALASCSEDQTEFNVDNVPGRAKVSGTIVYNEGTTIENGRFTYNYKPLASHEVILEVPNNYYKSGSEGVTVYTATTDANGKYSFEVPATNVKGNGIISIRPFEGTTSNVEIVDSKPVAVAKQVIFRGSTGVSLKARGLEIENFQCQANEVGKVPESYSKTVSLKVVIGKNMEYKKPIAERYNNNNVIIDYADAEISKLWQPAANVDFIVDIDYSEIEPFVVNGTTDANGECVLRIPAEKLPTQFTYSVTPLSYLGKFTHYVAKIVERRLPSGSKVEVTDYEAVSIDGWYSSNGDVTGTADYAFSTFVKKTECKSMVFNVPEGTDGKGYTSNGWYDNSLWLAEYLENQSK